MNGREPIELRSLAPRMVKIGVSECVDHIGADPSTSSATSVKELIAGIVECPQHVCGIAGHLFDPSGLRAAPTAQYAHFTSDKFLCQTKVYHASVIALQLLQRKRGLLSIGMRALPL